jgi:hypothetical protein
VNVAANHAVLADLFAVDVQVFGMDELRYRAQGFRIERLPVMLRLAESL